MKNNILQDLYNSEINAAIWWNCDGGIEVRLGGGLYNDDKNWEAKGNVDTIDKVETWMKETAIELYPNSVFAEKYNLRK